MGEKNDKVEMLKYCFNVLRNQFDDNFKIPLPLFNNILSPLFVTLKIKRKNSNKYELKGCIGTFEQVELKDGLKKYVKYSAFKDSRFNPLTKEEFPNISIDISLLHDFEDIGNKWKDWIIGTHGINLDFEYDGKYYHATYLPEVAFDQKWNQKETIENLIRKSGFRGIIDTSLFNSLKLKRYKSSEFGMTYNEYLKLA